MDTGSCGKICSIVAMAFLTRSNNRRRIFSHYQHLNPRSVGCSLPIICIGRHGRPSGGKPARAGEEGDDAICGISIHR